MTSSLKREPVAGEGARLEAILRTSAGQRRKSREREGARRGKGGGNGQEGEGSGGRREGYGGRSKGRGGRKEW